MHEVQMRTTGISELDAAMGGGFPDGRLVELFGPRAADMVRRLRRPMLHDLGSGRAYAAEVVHELEHGVVTKPGRGSLVVVDVTAKPYDSSGVLDDGWAAFSTTREIASALRRVTPDAYRHGYCLVWVTRGERRVEAIRFYASVRVEFRDAADGRVRARVVKNKCAAPFGEALLEL